jgi:uncharacterized protein (TIGR04255 family)
MKLPLKLGKEPVIEAVVELRFRASFPASSILPGVLFASLQGKKSLARLPAAELPQQIRNTDPNLAYAALIKIDWEGYTILVSDRSVALACGPPYPGWHSLKAALLNVVDAVGKTQVVETVDRFSVKYSNIFPKEFGDLGSVVDLDLRIGPHSSVGKNVEIRAEIPSAGLVSLVHIATDANALLPDGSTRGGPLLEIDTIAVIGNTKFSDFLSSIADQAELAHAENKALFFTCVKPDIVQKMEPFYG